MELLLAEPALQLSEVLTIPAIKASSRLNDAQTISRIVEIALAGARELGCDARLVLIGHDGFRTHYQGIGGGFVRKSQMPPAPVSIPDGEARHTIFMSDSFGMQLGHLTAPTDLPHVWEQLEVLAFQVAAAVERVQAVDAMGNAEKHAGDLARTLKALQEDVDVTHQVSGTSTFRWNYVSGKDQWSRNHFLLLGYNPDVDKPDYKKFLAGADPQDLIVWLETTEAAVTNGVPFRWEGRYTKPDGTIRHFLVHARPDRDTWFHGTVLDLTELKENEEKLRRIQQELEQASRLTAVGELAAAIAHEINQPLTSIVANASASLRWFNRDEPNIDQMRTSLQAIISESKRAGDMIRGLQSLQGARPSQQVMLDPLEIVSRVMQAMRPTASLRNVVLRSDFAATPFLVECDGTQIEQLVHNLILNAFDALHPVSNRQRMVSVNAKPSGNVFRIAIEDNGVGIDNESLEKVFEAFYSTKETGMGMGLSICRSIVDAHGGKLSVERRDPHGSIFIAELPQGPRG